MDTFSSDVRLALRMLAKTLLGIVFLAVPAILAGVALAAVWLPAVRAGRVHPIHALRYE
jgi:ABC-type antimicrobial peptide transport system permease subunit